MSTELGERHRIRHPLPPVRWPTREEAARALWFSPAAFWGRYLDVTERLRRQPSWGPPAEPA